MSVAGIKKAACVGGGVIGAGWAARLLWHGIDVAITDPHPDAERRCRVVLDNAERALGDLLGVPSVAPGRLSFAGSIAEAVQGADYVQESGPEDIAVKQQILADVDRHAPLHGAVRPGPQMALDEAHGRA